MVPPISSATVSSVYPVVLLPTPDGEGYVVGVEGNGQVCVPNRTRPTLLVVLDSFLQGT